jgi:hypothetical protein
MQVYDLSAVDGALFGGWLLFHLRSVRAGEAIVGILAAATLLAAHWLAPHPVYAAASIICPLSFVAYVLYTRRGWQRLRLFVRRSMSPIQARARIDVLEARSNRIERRREVVTHRGQNTYGGQ